MLGKAFLFLFVVLWGGLLYVAYMLVSPAPLFKQNTPMSVEPTVVTAQASFIKLHSDTCVFSDKPATIEIYLAQVGSATKILKNESKLRPGCRVSDLPLPTSLIPPYIPNGQYYIRFEVTASPSPLRTVTQSLNTTIFTLKR